MGDGSGVRLALRSAVARIAVLGISLVLGLVITRWLISGYGADVYAQYGLLVGLAALLPFTDLGIGAAVMNAVGESGDPARDQHVRGVLLTSLRALLASASVLTVIAVALTVAGWWPAVLGEALDPTYGNVVAGMCLVLFAATVPLSVGQRILSGSGRNHLVVALAGLQSPLVLLALVALLPAGPAGGWFVPVASYAALLVIAAVAGGIGLRAVGPVLRPAIGDVLRRGRHGAKAAHTAVPMLVMSIALPLSLQTDRIVLSHVTDAGELARYSMAAQLFTPLRLVVSAAGFALWAHYARARSRDPGASPFPMSALFGTAAVALTLSVSLLSPVIVTFASAGQLHLDAGLLVGFSALTVSLALTYPIGMFLSDPAGLRLQAVATVVLVPVNLGLSIALARDVGAAGPVLASAVTTAVLLAVQAAYARRTIRARLAAQPGQPVTGPGPAGDHTPARTRPLG